MESPTPRAINIAVRVQTMDRAGSAEERPERVVQGYPPGTVDTQMASKYGMNAESNIQEMSQLVRSDDKDTNEECHFCFYEIVLGSIQSSVICQH